MIAVGREDDLPVGGSQVAQAVEFVRALRAQLVRMTSQLAWIERQDVTRRNARAYAMRDEAAALRRDIYKAQHLIDRLQRRYLNANQHNKHGSTLRTCATSKPSTPNSDCYPWGVARSSGAVRPHAEY
jgi:hypothetical protein